LLYAALIGAGSGFVSTVLGWVSDTLRRRGEGPTVEERVRKRVMAYLFIQSGRSPTNEEITLEINQRLERYEQRVSAAQSTEELKKAEEVLFE
jgi:hypothetical protein